MKGGKMIVYVIGSNEGTTGLIRDLLLEKFSLVKTLLFTDSEQALQELEQQQSPCLIIVLNQSSPLKGVLVAKKKPAWIPCILLSGSPSVAKKELGDDTSNVTVLGMPFNCDELTDLVHEKLDDFHYRMTIG